VEANETQADSRTGDEFPALDPSISPLRRQVAFLEQEIEVMKKSYLVETRRVDKELKNRILNRMITQLAKLLKDVPRMDFEAGLVLRKTDVERTLGRFLKEIRAALDSLPPESGAAPYVQAD
jgi:hypothetical protein